MPPAGDPVELLIGEPVQVHVVVDLGGRQLARRALERLSAPHGGLGNPDALGAGAAKIQVTTKIVS